MPLFNIKGASTLSPEELDNLKISGLGLELDAKLGKCGAETDGATATIIMAIERGKIRGCKWALKGRYPDVKISASRLGGQDRKVVLDLSDLSMFNFPGDQDPRNGVNRSEWMPASQLASKIIIDKKEVTDKKAMEEDEYLAGGGFCVRLTILPIALGKVAIWMGAAPGDQKHIQEEADKRGLTEYSALIPTLGVPLGTTGGEGMTTARLCPSEGELVSKCWGQYPLIMVSRIS